MFLKNQDLGRQGRGCPEAELGKVFKMGCVGKQPRRAFPLQAEE